MLIRPMKKYQVRGTVAKEMSPAEIQKALQKIGKHIQAKRKSKTKNRDDFAYEINVARSSMQKHESGTDMFLSSFLKILYGLDIPPEDFFRDLK